MKTADRVSARVSLVLVTLATALALVALGRRREARATEGLVDRLLAGSAEAAERGRDREDRTALPDPVRRYFDTALPEGSRTMDGVCVEQAGRLRVGGPDSSWKPFTATHRATVRRPGFVWDATVSVLPLTPVRVRDAFVGGEGSSRVTLFGALPLGGATGSRELDEAALQRYLAEAVWYPAALLPEHGVSWEGVDDRTARATLVYEETTASLTFHFSEEADPAQGEEGGETVVERVHADRRYRAVEGGFEPTPWTGLWRDYENRDGVLVPTTGEVVWHLPEGDLHAWRGRVTSVDFER
ncbi:hypothetical protein C2R22_19500 [Salinigranum rubrum]|uniref:Uncharacterized protein n=1 Tax=Salinigranum rubrum TaxID=755307 RepID=A0A2I8VNQ6_9EURY|nr:DUF6544 family protein [Salinigranum rubrum]AUV83558.1 hypothetical protein C2R22_19500 [Salinigranum rubrum]